MNESIKHWYMKEFETDDLGFEIRTETTFKDLYIALENGSDIYDTIGVGDSLVRERLFNELSYRKDTDYNTIYNMWL